MKSISFRRLLFCSLVALSTGPGCSGCQQSSPKPEVETSQPAYPAKDPDSDKPSLDESGSQSPQVSQSEASKSNSGDPNSSTTSKGTSSSEEVGETEKEPSAGTGDTQGDQSRQGSRESNAAGSASALKRAKSMMQEAEEAVEKGDDQDAFEKATDAYSLVRRFPKDPECSALTEQIESRLIELSKAVRKLPDRQSIEDTSKPLVEQ